MARIMVSEKHHRITIRCDQPGEVLVVRGGKRSAYLWAAGDGCSPVTVTGEKVLRALAKAILKEVGTR